jgi:uncharacterized protein
VLAGSLVAGAYEKVVDRESAYEKLQARANSPAPASPTANGTQPSPADARAPAAVSGGVMDSLKDAIFGSTGPRGGRHEGLAEKAATSALRTMGSAVGRELIRGVLGSLLGRRR